jgi:apoptosis-inducing factor 2
MSRSTRVRLRVVVVGGGFAGATLARSLEDVCDVTLVDTKEFFEVNLAMPRAVVDATVHSRLTFLHTQYLRRAKFKQAVVAEVRSGTVATVTGEEIPFDRLFLCTGSSYSDPVGKASLGVETTSKLRSDYYAEVYETVKAAKSVLIVGGGEVGVELAAEIATEYPSKSVTVVHSHSTLLHQLRPRVSEIATEFLTGAGVKLRLGVRAAVDREAKQVTIEGDESAITADALFVCTGGSPNTAAMRANFSSCLDDVGHIKVNDFMQVIGLNNIFAIGDCTALAAHRAFVATEMARQAAKNVRRSLRGLEPKPFRIGGLISFVSLGRHFGVAQLPLGVWKGCLVRRLKSSDMLISRTWSSLGL